MKGRNVMFPVRTSVLALGVFLALSYVANAQTGTDAQRGFLGIMVDAAEGGNGVVVRDITMNSPAAKSGLKKGDRLVKVGDDDIRDVERFLQVAAAKKAGDSLVLGIVRDGKEQNVTVTLGQWPARFPAALPGTPLPRRPAFLGVQMQPLTPDTKKRLDIDIDSGAVVTDVVPNSPAAQAGIKRDDVITAVNDKPVKTPLDLRETIQKTGPGKEVAFQLTRGKEHLAVKATLRESAFGFFLAPGEEHFPVDVETMFDHGRQIRELERRIEDLEKRLRDLEKK
jgi:serine protease Do